MILSADLHLRRSTPKARTDDYGAAQERKLRFILEQARISPPLLVAGDFFHQSRPGEGLLRWVIDLLREYNVNLICVPGQHDLPNHSLEQIGESGLGVLASAGVIELLLDPSTFFQTKSNNVWLGITGVPYGELPLDNLIIPYQQAILLWHHMVINSELWPGQEADKATAILRKYKQFNLIVTGDNHQSFAIANGDNPPRYLVNSGSMMRMTAAQVDHRPVVYRYENGRCTAIPLPIEDNVLDLTELEQTKERDSRISAFVERLSIQLEIGLEYKKNLEEHLRINEVKSEVKKIIWECVG